MKLFIIAFNLFFLVSCESNKGWDNKHINEIKTVCITKIKKSATKAFFDYFKGTGNSLTKAKISEGNKMIETVANNLCTCYVKEAITTWDYEEFNLNIRSYTEWILTSKCKVNDYM